MTQSTMSNICKDIIKLGLSRTIISGLTSAFQVLILDDLDNGFLKAT